MSNFDGNQPNDWAQRPPAGMQGFPAFPPGQGQFPAGQFPFFNPAMMQGMQGNPPPHNIPISLVVPPLPSHKLQGCKASPKGQCPPPAKVSLLAPCPILVPPPPPPASYHAVLLLIFS